MRTPLIHRGNMNARWRIFVAAIAALLAWATPALGQEQADNTQNAVVGPPQLRDFSIEGRVTREAPAPAQVQPPPPRQPSAQPPAGNTPGSPPRTGQVSSEPASRPQSRTAESAPPRQESSSARASGTGEASAATRQTEAIADSSPQPAFVPAPAETSAPAPIESPEPGLPILPWLIAAIAVGGAAIWYFTRQAQRERYAGAGAVAAFDAPAAVPPAPPPVRTPARPKPAASPPEGVVSTRLRPWLEIEFKPQRGVIDEQKAAVAFELTVLNSGSVPARDVLLEASLFNAGPVQDQQIQLFYDNPVAKGDRIPVIPPLQKVSVNTAVFLARDQVRAIEIEGRELFVPMIAFNALYRWSGGEGQTSASYLVGKETKSEKLAPFRLDQGPRLYRGLAAREHQLRLRK